MTYLTANVPIGAYDVNRQATVGMGRWAIDGGLGYTYFHEEKGLEFSAVAGLTYNFMNPYTAYQSGIDLHVEVSASKYLTERFLAGAAGYFYQQITADSGPGATLGPFISRVAGVGPQLGYDFALGRRSASLSARGYYEFAGQNRPQGWSAWLTFVVSLGVPGQKPHPEPQQGGRAISYLNRYLEPAESLAEILFGLIMVLTCTLGASVIAGIDRDSLRSLFIAALGCNVAWGIIDAALYVMGAVFVRTRNARIMQAVRSANGDAAALAIVRQALEPRFGAYGRDEDREQFYRGLRRMIVHSDGRRSLLTRDDLGSAIVVFVLVAATALPPAVPFLLIADPVVALRVSNVVLVALLFVVGFYWARSIGGNGWRTGTVLMLSGVLLVGIAIVFGG